jgi:peptide deformylase
MNLIKYPNPLLSQKSQRVEIGDPTVPAILTEMVTKMYEWNGVGLAGPQVGISKRIIVVNILNPDILYKMINPEIVEKSDQLRVFAEGCLSIPLVRAEVMRHEYVKVEYYDCDYQKQTIEATGLMATCLQHEIDHLDGILFIHKLDKLERAWLLRQSRRLVKANEKKAAEGMKLIDPLVSEEKCLRPGV